MQRRSKKTKVASNKEYYGGYNAYEDKRETKITKSNKKNKSFSFLSSFRKFIKPLFYPRKFKKYYKRLIFFVLLPFLIFAMGRLFIKNSIAVYLESQLLGYIKNSKNFDESNFEKLINNKLKHDIDMDVLIDTKPKFAKINVNKKNILDQEDLVDKIYNKFTYQVNGIAISVNGRDLVILKNKEDANAIIEQVKNFYIQPDANIIEARFLEDVTTKNKFVKYDEINSKEEAYDILSGNSLTEEIYRVQQGDNLSSIAKKYNMSLENILSLNEGLSIDTVLFVDHQIKVNTSEPVLSVFIKEEKRSEELIKKQTEFRPNIFENIGYTKLISQGTDGKNEIVEHISKINGVEVERTVISKKMITQPTIEIVERGTR